MPKDLKRTFAAAEAGDFEKALKEIVAFTSSFDARPKLRYMAALRAADAGHEQEARAFAKTLTISEGDEMHAHLELAKKYAEGTDGLSMNLDAIVDHFREAKKRLKNPALFNPSIARLLVSKYHERMTSPELRARFEAVFSDPHWNLAAVPAAPPKSKPKPKPSSKKLRRLLLARFAKLFRKAATLEFTAAQKKALRKKLGVSLNDKGLSAIQTSFFDYTNLEDQYVDSLWAYGLANSDLEEKVDEGVLVPFAALNTDGSSFDLGGDEFAETNNWGILCLDVSKADGDDCPVIWVVHGELMPWAAMASALKARA